MGKCMSRYDLDTYKYKQAPLQNTRMSYICSPADVEIHAIYSKFNKVVCVIKTVVLADTDFNCFFIPLSHCMSPTLLSVMLLYDSCAPPGGPEASSELQQGPRGNLLEMLTC